MAPLFYSAGGARAILALAFKADIDRCRIYIYSGLSIRDEVCMVDLESIASRMIDVVAEVLAEKGICPQRQSPTVLYGSCGNVLGDHTFFVEAIADPSDVLMSFEDVRGFPETELPTMKAKIDILNADEACSEQGKRWLRVVASELRLGRSKVILVCKIGSDGVTVEHCREKVATALNLIRTKWPVESR